MRPARSGSPLPHHVLQLVLAAVACLPLPTAADDHVDAVLYRLGASSACEEGCFAPCMCPVMMNDTLQGTFLLSPSGRGGETAAYSVLEVTWTYRRGDADIPVVGSGSYTQGTGGQRLELDLVTGDGPPDHYDSGFVPLTRDFPQIDLAVAANGFFCYDHVFVVSAFPVTVAVESSSWGALKATYR